MFYDALVKVDGYETMRITEIAQKVQKSAYPEAYADHEQEGRLLASTLSGHSPEGWAAASTTRRPVEPAALAADLTTELGVKADDQRRHGDRASAGSERVAWAAGAYAVAKASQYGATRVQVGSREWVRTRDADGWQWQVVEGRGQADARTVTVSFAR